MCRCWKNFCIVASYDVEGQEANYRQMTSLNTVGGIDLGPIYILSIFKKLFNIIGSSLPCFVLALKVLLWSTIIASNALCLAAYGLSKQSSVILCLLIIGHIMLSMWIEWKSNSTNIWSEITCFILILNIWPKQKDCKESASIRTPTHTSHTHTPTHTHRKEKVFS